MTEPDNKDQAATEEQIPGQTEVNVEAEQVVVNTAEDGGGNDGDVEKSTDE